MDYEPTNPRWLLWRVCCCPVASTGAHEFMAWNTERWAEFAKDNRRRRPYSKQDHADYDEWLILWAHKFLSVP